MHIKKTICEIAIEAAAPYIPNKGMSNRFNVMLIKVVKIIRIPVTPVFFTMFRLTVWAISFRVSKIMAIEMMGMMKNDLLKLLLLEMRVIAPDFVGIYHLLFLKAAKSL
jgi:hypothetical protein